jgi:hypothetical protein
MKQFLINLWNAQKNAWELSFLQELYEFRLKVLGEAFEVIAEYADDKKKLEAELNSLRASLPSRDSKGRFKRKGQ